VENFTKFFRLLHSFLLTTAVTTEEEMSRLEQDIEADCSAADFSALMTFYIVWGQKPHQ
jgi:hypothetical protein